MKILHRVTVNVDGDLRRDFGKVGFFLEEGLQSFDVDEGDWRWPEVSALLSRVGRGVDLPRAIPTETEIASAPYLSVSPSWHHGYPQPEDEFLAVTYDLSNYCATCGVGKRQRSPFRFARSPKWGKQSILQLHWIYDEYFVTPRAWTAVFEPLGLSCGPVLGPGDRELENVVQLLIPECDKRLDLTRHPSAACGSCGRRKGQPYSLGCFPSFERGTPVDHLMKSEEWFGSGAEAHRVVICTQRLCQVMKAASIKGVSFFPLCHET